MGLGDRTKQGIERWFTTRTAPGQPTWGDRLAGWGAGLLDKGARSFLDSFEPDIIDLVREPLRQLKEDPNVPAPIRGMVDRATDGSHFFQALIIILLVPLILIPMISSAFQPVGNLIRYGQELVVRSFRFDPMSWVTMFRRYSADAERFKDDLRSQGWTDERIDTLEKITRFYPSPQDLVTWTAREVFEPDSISKYGLTDEFDRLDLSLFSGAGVSEDQAKNYWIAHWQHASFNEVVEMLRRGLITIDDMRDWFRLVEIPPYWRDRLIGISWNVPTRVDVRRFWDLRTIDEVRLREIYTSLGYHDKDLDDYVLWTKIYVDFPDLITRYKNGWLTIDEVKQQLVALGMSDERAEELIQTKVKAAASEKLAKDKDLTMSQIVKGVKKAVISREEGSALLQTMGYDADEAEFILAIEIPQDEVVTEVKRRELTKTDVLNGLKTGVITPEEALERLVELRYTQDDAEFLLSIYEAAAKPPEEPKLKEASKADVVSAVKKGLITAEAAYLMLQDIGYSPEASEFILMVQAEESPFSPNTMDEYNELINKWRRIVTPRTAGQEKELRAAASELVRVRNEVRLLRRAVEEERAQVIETPATPESATAELTDRQVQLNRAEAELERVQQRYNTLAARFRYSSPG